MAKPDVTSDALTTLVQTVSAFAATRVRDPRSTVIPFELSRGVGASGAAAGTRKDGRDLVAGERSLVLGPLLGEGGMGAVYVATQVALRREVAVKLLRTTTGGPLPALDLLREARTLGALEHPNVVPVYDLRVDDKGDPMVLLRRIDGVDWGKLLHDGQAIEARFGTSDPLEWNLRVLIQVCNSVAYAHSRGIVHRDIKPSNVMIGAFGEVYLVDWGLAVAMWDDDRGLFPAASVTEFAGTPCYMAPEMLGETPSRIGPHTDTYLLGALLYEILTGSPPHDKPSLTAIVTSVLLSPPGLPDDVPREAAPICARAMAAEPAHRFSDVVEFRRALEEFLQHRGSIALCRLADERRVALASGIAENQDEDALFILVSECRFGYRAALEAWPENEEAKLGYAGAFEAMAGHLLARGDPHGAMRLLRELPSPAPALHARALAACQAKDEAQRELTALQSNLNPKTGARTRAVAILLVELPWVALPTAYQIRGDTLTYLRLLTLMGLATALLGIVTYWARESLQKTLINRRATMNIVGMAVMAFSTVAIGWSTGLSPLTSVIIVSATTGGILAANAIWVEPRLGLSLLPIAIGLIVLVRYPEFAFGMMAIVSATILLIVMWAWFPRKGAATARPPVL